VGGAASSPLASSSSAEGTGDQGGKELWPALRRRGERRVDSRGDATRTEK